ncbi:hypothetical protein ABIF67_009988 [Bradyrhizobium japonicum]
MQGLRSRPASGGLAGAATSVGAGAWSGFLSAAFSVVSGCVSFDAAGSGGAMIDLDGTSGSIGSADVVSGDCDTSEAMAAFCGGGIN